MTEELTLDQAVEALHDLSPTKLEIAIKALEVIEEDSATASPHTLGLIASAALITIKELK